MNEFDFYYFEISLGGSRVREAKKLGIDPASVQSHKSMVRYGYKVFPKYTYTATVGFMDAVGATREKVDAMAAELSAKYGREVHVCYCARD